MNKRKTNLFVTVLNSVLLMIAYVLKFYIEDYTYISDMEQYAFGNFITNIFTENVNVLVIIIFSIVGISNIILAIQNRKNKKLFFWQIILGLLEAWFLLCTWIDYVYIDYYDIHIWMTGIIFVVVPCIFTIVNLILSKKRKVSLIKIISYIAVTVFTIFIVLGLEILTGDYFYETINPVLCWSIISIVMQIVYICNQDESVVESNKRKIFNIVIYYVLEIGIIILTIFMLIYSIITIRINEGKWEKGINELNGSIKTLQGTTISDVYIPVMNGKKYGFINEEGKEKIPCEYDYVTKFLEVECYDDTIYFAMAEKDNDYYIISKDNDSKIIENDLEKYIKNIVKRKGKSIDSIFYDILDIGYSKNEQFLEKNTEEITLEAKNGKYYYKSGIYSIMIKQIIDEESSNDYEFINNKGKKCKIEIKKSDEEMVSDVVFLPGLEIGSTEAKLTIFSDGFIKFVNEEGTREGWYDFNGEKRMCPINYRIMDIKKDKIILNKLNTQSSDFSEEYFVMNKSGEVLFKTSGILEVYSNVYILTKNDGKFYLLDDKLNTISDGYDYIDINY